MKFDVLTVGAVAFAGFATLYVLRPKTAPTTAGQVFGLAANQRQASGAAVSQNQAALNAAFYGSDSFRQTVNTIWGIP